MAETSRVETEHSAGAQGPGARPAEVRQPGTGRADTGAAQAAEETDGSVARESEVAETAPLTAMPFLGAWAALDRVPVDPVATPAAATAATVVPAAPVTPVDAPGPAAPAPTGAPATAQAAAAPVVTAGAAQAAAWTEAEAQATTPTGTAGIPLAPSGAAQTTGRQADAAAQAAVTPPPTVPPASPAAPTTTAPATTPVTPVRSAGAEPTGDGTGPAATVAPAPSATPATAPNATPAAAPTATPIAVPTTAVVTPEAAALTVADSAVPAADATATGQPEAASATAEAPVPALGDQGGSAGGDAAGQGADRQQSGAGTNTTLNPPVTTAAPGTDASFGVPGAAGVAATAPTAPATPTAPVAAAPPPAPATPGPLVNQLATRIVPLRLDADAVHRLTVNLHPVDLGPVQVIAEIRNGEINVQLASSTDAGHESLRNALEDLRRELQQAGFSNTSLDLRQGTPQEQARQQFAFLNNDDGTRGENGPATAESARPVPAEPLLPGTNGNSRLDIQA
jgi:flagellar hook-length control protein FliK